MNKKQEEFTREFTSFIQEQGFIWGPEPEIYGGLAGFYTYGPLGKLLKNKVENNIRKVFKASDFWELEGPTVLPNIVWEASGHLGNFIDKVVICSKCNKEFRADKLIEEATGKSSVHLSDELMLKEIKKNKILCPSCDSEFRNEVSKQSLMMLTRVAGKDAGLRPETATVTYLPFKRYYMFLRKKMPLGVFQIGKAYRNEISPRQSVIRGREFTQAEGQLYVDPIQKNKWEKFEDVKKEKLPLWSYQLQDSKKDLKPISLGDAIKDKTLKNQAYAWCLHLAYTQFKELGVPEDRIRLRQHHPDERAFYADDAWDLEINLNSLGWTECCGIHDRTDYDLKQHAKFSKQTLEAERENGEKFIPHVLEIAFGTDRPTYALLDLFYEKMEKEEGKTMFKIPYQTAPIDIAIYPLIKKDELIAKAKKIKKELEDEFIVIYDETGSIGRRYLRSTTYGIPFCITIDFDAGVTIRDRNTEKQIRVDEGQLKSVIHKLFNREIQFEHAGKLVNKG
ncbi:glycine--tRNA ligase [Candidatus Woesearchaeota archaeon]|nr:hypothetical protein [uncultured archaeon]MBS3167255.1 glycine--tRNA ligase [Candidatus Woesearchaeota archaeon]